MLLLNTQPWLVDINSPHFQGQIVETWYPQNELFCWKKPQTTFPGFETINLGQAAPECSQNTVTGTFHSFLTELYKHQPQPRAPGACAFSLFRKFLLSTVTALQNISCLEATVEKHEGKGSLRFRKKKKALQTLKISLELVRCFSHCIISTEPVNNNQQHFKSVSVYLVCESIEL